MILDQERARRAFGRWMATDRAGCTAWCEAAHRIDVVLTVSDVLGDCKRTPPAYATHPKALNLWLSDPAASFTDDPTLN